MARPRVDPKKQRDKRTKIAAVIGGVLLLGLLGFQAPKVLAKMNAKPPPLPGVVQPPNGFPAGTNVPLAAPTLAGSNGSAPKSSNGVVDLSAVAPEPSPGQLSSFSRFASKDPFAQQVDTSGTGGSSGSGSSNPTPPATPPAPPIGGTGSGSGSGSGTVALPTTAMISVNGVAELVTVGADFPTANPIFHLVTLTRTTARISIAGGSYSDGRATVVLKKGKKVTLENTADGTRYVIRLVSLGSAPSSSQNGGTSTATTPTVTTTLTP
jgi:hypothetical protein